MQTLCLISVNMQNNLRSFEPQKLVCERKPCYVYIKLRFDIEYTRTQMLQ